MKLPSDKCDNKRSNVVLVPDGLEYLFFLSLLIVCLDQTVHGPAVFAERIGQRRRKPRIGPPSSDGRRTQRRPNRHEGHRDAA